MCQRKKIVTFLVAGLLTIIQSIAYAGLRTVPEGEARYHEGSEVYLGPDGTEQTSLGDNTFILVREKDQSIDDFERFKTELKKALEFTYKNSSKGKEMLDISSKVTDGKTMYIILEIDPDDGGGLSAGFGGAREDIGPLSQASTNSKRFNNSSISLKFDPTHDKISEKIAKLNAQSNVDIVVHEFTHGFRHRKGISSGVSKGTASYEDRKLGWWLEEAENAGVLPAHPDANGINIESIMRELHGKSQNFESGRSFTNLSLKDKQKEYNDDEWGEIFEELLEKETDENKKKLKEDYLQMAKDRNIPKTVDDDLLEEFGCS